MKLCGFPPPSLDTPPSLLSRLVINVGNINAVRGEYEHNTAHHIFGHNACVQDGCSLKSTIVEGPIERHRSRLASCETGDGLRGTHSGRSLGRTESVPTRSRTRRACAGLRTVSQRDKAMRSMPPFPPENDSFRFFIIVWLFVFSTIYSSNIT